MQDAVSDDLARAIIASTRAQAREIAGISDGTRFFHPLRTEDYSWVALRIDNRVGVI